MLHTEEFEEYATRKAKSYARQKVKRLNGFTLFFCLLALASGLAVGVYGYEYLCRNDCFEVVGEKEISVELNTSDFTYTDSGAQVIEFGRDISESVNTETNMTSLGGGVYTLDTTVPGRYYIKYTVESPKYGQICRIRTFVVGGEN